MVRDITGTISYLWKKIERFRTDESNEPMDIINRAESNDVGEPSIKCHCIPKTIGSVKRLHRCEGSQRHVSKTRREAVN